MAVNIKRAFHKIKIAKLQGRDTTSDKVKSKPTQVRIVNSATVIPSEFLTRDLRLKTWPRKLTNIVTKDNSIVFAKPANKIEAVDGVNEPLVLICSPYRGRRTAMKNQMPENMVEYMQRHKTDTEVQLLTCE